MVAVAPPPLPPRYRPEPPDGRALLGRGGASEVWRCRDEVTGTRVAVKVLRASGATFQARLEREAAVVAGIDHPNVVALHDMGRTPDGRPFVAFALAAGGTLLERTAGPLSWRNLSGWLQDLLAGLAALHARELVHLDLKLSNLLLHPVGPRRTVLWIADLEVARAMRAEEHDELVGTVGYMPPERLTGRRELWGPATDLFSVGVVLYRLLSGTLPFPAQDPAEALAQRRAGPPPLSFRPGAEAPAGIEEVVEALLRYDPVERADTAADVARALRRLPEPVPARPVLRPPPEPPPTRLYLRGPARRPPQAPALVVHRETPFAGRRAELDRVWAAAMRAREERRPVLVEVTGPAGIGRGRLVAEVTRTLEELGLAEGVRLEPGRAGRSGLGRAWRAIHPPGPRLVARIAARLARDRGVAAQAVRLDAAALAEWIEGGRRGRALARALFVEHVEHRAWRGLGWLFVPRADLAGEADDCWPVLDLLLERRSPLLLLVTTREPAPALDELRARHPGRVERVALGPLSEEAAARVAAGLLPLEPGLARRIARRAGGRPARVRALVLHLVRGRALVEARGGAAWTLRRDVLDLPPDGPAFARRHLELVLREHPELDEPVRLLALSPGGLPERVLERVAGEAVHRLVVQGLARARAGRVEPDPPELSEVVPGDPALHLRLAAAWAAEPPSPEADARRGRHLLRGGRPAEALPVLARALDAGAAVMPVPEVEALALDALRAAEAAGRRPPLAVSLALAGARFRAGGDPGPLVEGRPEPAAACLHARALAADGRPEAGLERVAAARAGSRAEEGELLVARAACALRLLRCEEALADVVEGLARPLRPETRCRALLLRVRLVELGEPALAWHEAMQAIEIARDHGLFVYETLAWGLAARLLERTGRGGEARERLRAGVRRLEAHGARRAAAELRLLRAALEGPEVLGEPPEAEPPRLGLAPLGWRATVAAGRALAGDEASLTRLHRPSRDPAERVAWALLAPLARRGVGLAPRPPAEAAARDAARLGPVGIALAEAAARCLEDAGMGEDAAAVRRAVRAGLAALGALPASGPGGPRPPAPAPP